MVEGLSKSDVAPVVRAHVVAKLPHPPEERGGREHGDRERQEVIDGGISLFVGQRTAGGVSPKDRDDLEAEQIRSDDSFASDPFAESSTVVSLVGHDRREDRRVNDQHVPLR